MSNKTYRIAESVLFSPAIFKLSKKDKDIKLSNKEAELLEMLCDQAGSVISRTTIQDTLWRNQENTDTNLNRQILSLRRKLESFGVMDAIDTIPRVGYIFSAPIVPVCETDEVTVAEEVQSSQPTDVPQMQTRHRYGRRKYDRYFNPKRIIIYIMLLVVMASIIVAIYNYATANTLKTIKLGYVSLYMTSETEKVLNVKIEDFSGLLSKISRNADEQISIVLGKEAISFFSIDNNNQYLSGNVFLYRTDHSVIKELQCAIATQSGQNENITNNYFSSPYTITRYHRSCLASNNWVEVTRKTKIITTSNREMVISTITAVDHQGKTLFSIDSVGDISRDDSDISVEIKNSIVNFVDQKALNNNSMVATLISAMAPPKHRAMFVQLPGGIYLSNYLGGVITWPNRETLNVIQHN